MKLLPTALPEVLLIEPRVSGDERGSFVEAFHQKAYADAGITRPFVQDILSRAMQGTLRGLHFQVPEPRGKLVQCLAGAVWDVAVDIRRGSPSFGRWVAVELSAHNRHQLWVPPGFAHGSCVLSESADVLSRSTTLYAPADERTIAWNDGALNIPWPVQQPLLSPKDAGAPGLAKQPVLPEYRR